MKKFLFGMALGFVGACLGGAYAFAVAITKSEAFSAGIKNTIADSVESSVKTAVYGKDRSPGYYPGHAPWNKRFPSTPQRYRTYKAPIMMNRSPDEPTAFIISSAKEANEVVEQMKKIVDLYKIVSMADLKELLGFSYDRTDQQQGWTSTDEIYTKQVREGWELVLPATVSNPRFSNPQPN